jgi:hypothetical protein
MKKIFFTIIKSKYGKAVFLLFSVSIMGCFLLYDALKVNDNNDLAIVKETVNCIDRVIVNRNKVHPVERDSTYHIFLNEYPSKFQVSYFPYNRKKFFRNTRQGDSITMNISKEDKNKLYISGEKIRSFSLKVNDKIYLSGDDGLGGYRSGRFFSSCFIIIPLIINIYLLKQIFSKK